MSQSSSFKMYQTNISRAYWCTLTGKKAIFEPAESEAFGQGNNRPIAWFDKLFEGGICLPNSGGRPLTLLLTGPPGGGKTTFAFELCYRMAKEHNFFSLYISTEAETSRLADKAFSFGYEGIRNHIAEYDKEVQRPNAITIWGVDKIEQSKKWENLSDIVSISLEMIGAWLTGEKVAEKVASKLTKLIIRDEKTNNIVRAAPDLLVIDSLNMVKKEDKGSFFDKILSMTSNVTKLVIVVLDSGHDDKEHEYWEYVCDSVIRLDYNVVKLDLTNLRDYYIRTIEIVKSRYQPHVSGKHQLKIYPQFVEPHENDQDYKARMRRAHPYRIEGGIFIYPSIHYYLSFYKRRGTTIRPETVQTPLTELNKTIGGGLPEGRCTAFMGGRGGHKSHLGYRHILHRIEHNNERGLIISLRDDEEMTRATLRKILKQEVLFDPRQELDFIDKNDSELDNIVEQKLEYYELNNQVEILYYPPGYITPDEFFHRMIMSVNRLKRHSGKLTVLFNSLDQLSARFPLCAQQPIFIPGIIESLTGEQATSIFIAVDEPGQPAEQYGLLPMADLVLTFNQHRFQFEDYFNHHEDLWQTDNTDLQFREKVYKIRAQSQNSYRDVIVLQVSRFAGGQQAGARGLLELVDLESIDDSLFQKPGLHFTKLNPKYSHGDLIK